MLVALLFCLIVAAAVTVPLSRFLINGTNRQVAVFVTVTALALAGWLSFIVMNPVGA